MTRSIRQQLYILHAYVALKVDAGGNASIEFLDAQGKVVQRIAPAGSDR